MPISADTINSNRLKSKWTFQLRTPLSERADRAILSLLEAQMGTWDGPSESLTRSALQRLMEQGHVRLNGEVITPRLKMGIGTLEINIPQPEPLNLIPEAHSLEILFEDEHLAVINKPAGISVHPSDTEKSGTLVHALLYQIKDLSGVGGVARPGIVHRLDKDTSGALVISKTDLAHQGLSEIFKKHEIERMYWAICYGSPRKSGLWSKLPSTPFGRKLETHMGRNPKDRKRMAVLLAGDKESRIAVTHFNVLEEHHAASLIAARLETGRTHQVRVHLTHLGSSLLGDPVYGTPSLNHTKWRALTRDVQLRALDLPGQALHARVLGFKHPITGEKLRFEAPPPKEFQELLDTLRKAKS